MFSGLVTAWRFATWPTRISPSLVNATTDGVTRLPSWLGMTTGSPPSMTATTELVVPRSMPITLPITGLQLPWQRSPGSASPDVDRGVSLLRRHPLSSQSGRAASAAGLPFGKPDRQHAAVDTGLGVFDVDVIGQGHGTDESAVPALGNLEIAARVLLLLALFAADQQAVGRDGEFQVVLFQPGHFGGDDDFVVRFAHVDGRHELELADRRKAPRLFEKPLQPAIEVVPQREDFRSDRGKVRALARGVRVRVWRAAARRAGP